jgi:hypothetical protein
MLAMEQTSINARPNLALFKGGQIDEEERKKNRLAGWRKNESKEFENACT